jgi:hypothetical protein
MKWPFASRRRIVSQHIREVDGRLSEINREIRRLDRFIARPKPEKKRDEVTVARLLGPTVMPDSKKRFVSYLSTGSFQTIGLRKHEQRAARIKAGIVMVVIILAAFFLVYTFVVPLFR